MKIQQVAGPPTARLAMGAIASDGLIVFNEDVATGLGISVEAIRQVAEREI